MKSIIEHLVKITVNETTAAILNSVRTFSYFVNNFLISTQMFQVLSEVRKKASYDVIFVEGPRFL